MKMILYKFGVFDKVTSTLGSPIRALIVNAYMRSIVGIIN